jgi:hypothetical protein
MVGKGLVVIKQAFARMGAKTADNTGVKRARPSLAQGSKERAGGTSGLHRTA